MFRPRYEAQGAHGYPWPVIDRRDIGSWLEGPRARTVGDSEYPGQALGMPQSGPGSIARFGPRLVAILIDWAIATVIASAFFKVPWPATGSGPFIILGIFGVMNLLLVGTIGTTIGHRIMGMRVIGMSGGRATFFQAAARTILLCLGLPAVVWDRDGRGLHDKIPNTVIVRTR